MGASGQSSSSSSDSYSWNKSLSEYLSGSLSSNFSVSQNTSSSQNSSQSGTSESRLSTLQGNILEERNNLANSYFFPELQSSINATKAGSAENNALMEQNANAINTSYDAANKATQQTISQQGLNNNSGVTAALTAANNRARSSSLAQAYFNQLSNSQTNKASLLNTMASLMPSTTNSAEYYSTSSSNGTSSSQGTSQSEGASVSLSEGTSSSSGESFSKSESSSFGLSGSIMG